MRRSFLVLFLSLSGFALSREGEKGKNSSQKITPQIRATTPADFPPLIFPAVAAFDSGGEIHESPSNSDSDSILPTWEPINVATNSGEGGEGTRLLSSLLHPPRTPRGEIRSEEIRSVRR